MQSSKKSLQLLSLHNSPPPMNVGVLLAPQLIQCYIMKSYNLIVS